MQEIYDTNDNFNFDNLVLTKPTLITGGNYFIRCLINNAPIYIQPPKCNTKNGIMKAGKRFYTDLMFTNENEKFIRWMENLENHCQQFIHKNREKWFDGEMELHDIENYFTSPLKIYKSGKYYIARTNIPGILGKPTLKIYDENEHEIDYESIDDKTNMMTILEIQGIKCSARSFQIDLEIKQIMILKPNNLFEKCIIKPESTTIGVNNDSTHVIQNTKDFNEKLEKENITAIIVDSEADQSINMGVLPAVINTMVLTKDFDTDYGSDNNTQNIITQVSDIAPTQVSDITPTQVSDIAPTQVPFKEDPAEAEDDNTGYSIIEPTRVTPLNNYGMEEVEFHLEELSKNDCMQLKNRNDVYYEMYKEARKKAKIARDIALSAYLEVKRIKNTYMLNNDKDSDEGSESDLEALETLDDDSIENDYTIE